MVNVKFLSIVSLLAFALPVLSVTVRINHLGDSITGSPGCWRAYLWQKLQAAGITNTDFVGTLTGQSCGFTFDAEHDGHGGFLATGIVSNNQLPGWLAVSKPDVVTMMLGTNDVWSHLATSTILQAYTTLVGQMRAQNPKMVVIVAQILPMNPSGCSDCNAGVIALNAAIPAWAAGITTTQSPVTVVNLYNGFSTASDTGDGVHPNDAGNQKIATTWFAPLSAVIKSFGSSSSTVTAAPTTTTRVSSTTTTSAAATSTGCSGGTVPLYGQCGGNGYSGSTSCQGCARCVYVNEWYSQCLT